METKGKGKRPQLEDSDENVVDLNRLVAQKLKAEMSGNFELVRELEEKISKASKTSQTRSKAEDRKVRKVDEDMSIAQMVEHEKLASSTEFEEELAKRMAKTSRFSTRSEDQEEFTDQFAAPSGQARREKCQCTKRNILHLGGSSAWSECRNAAGFVWILDRPTRAYCWRMDITHT